METFKICIGIVRANISKWKGNTRIFTGVFLYLVLFFAYLAKVPVYCIENEMTCTPFVQALLFSGGMNSNGSFKVLFFFIAIVLFCKAPFLDDQSMVMITKTGRKRWMMGEMLYIVLVSVILVLFVFGVSFVSTAPCMEKNIHEWGLLPLKALADAGIRREYGVMNGWHLEAEVLLFTDPFTTSLFTSMFVCMDLVILALVIYAGNIYVPKYNLGLILAAAIVLIDPVINALTNDQSKFLLILSPMSYCSLNFYKSISGKGILSINTAFIMSLIWMMILGILIFIKTRKMDIMLYNTD